VRQVSRPSSASPPAGPAGSGASGRVETSVTGSA
jgi:hypothetical protein